MKQLRGFLYQEEEVAKDKTMIKENIFFNELINVGAKEV